MASLRGGFAVPSPDKHSALQQQERALAQQQQVPPPSSLYPLRNLGTHSTQV